MPHILSWRSIALTQGRYIWRHDKDLREKAAMVENGRTRERTSCKRTGINFVKDGAGR